MDLSCVKQEPVDNEFPPSPPTQYVNQDITYNLLVEKEISNQEKTPAAIIKSEPSQPHHVFQPSILTNQILQLNQVANPMIQSSFMTNKISQLNQKGNNQADHQLEATVGNNNPCLKPNQYSQLDIATKLIMKDEPVILLYNSFVDKLTVHQTKTNQSNQQELIDNYCVKLETFTNQESMTTLDVQTLTSGNQSAQQDILANQHTQPEIAVYQSAQPEIAAYQSAQPKTEAYQCANPKTLVFDNTNLKSVHKKSLDVKSSKQKSTKVINKKSIKVIYKKSTKVINKKSTKVINKKSAEVIDKKSTKVINKKSTKVINKKSTRTSNKFSKKRKLDHFTEPEKSLEKTQRNIASSQMANTKIRTRSTRSNVHFSNGVQSERNTDAKQRSSTVDDPSDSSEENDEDMDYESEVELYEPSNSDSSAQKYNRTAKAGNQGKCMTNRSMVEKKIDILQLCQSLESGEEKTEESDPKLGKFKYHCDVCTMPFKKQIFLATHTEKQACRRCLVCGKLCTSHEVLKEHRQSNCSQKSSHNCYICEEDFSNDSEFETHIKSHRPDLDKDVSVKEELKCGTCELLFTSIVELQEHANNYSHFDGRPFQCSECDKRFIHDDDLRIHKKVHTRKDDVCDETFTTKSTLKKHKSSHRKDKNRQTKKGRRKSRKKSPKKCDKPNYECDLCHEDLLSAAGLNEHLEDHDRDIIEKDGGKSEQFDCDDCFASYGNQDTLNAHKKVHKVKPLSLQKTLSSRTIVCQFCGILCKSRLICERHVRIHTGEKPFSCKLCDKAFADKTTLTKHYVTHTKSRDYLCDICGKGYALPGRLKRHKIIHYPDRLTKFKCTVCDKSYAHKWELKKHTIALHSCNSDGPNSLKKQCPVCHKFIHPNYYKDHQQIHKERICQYVCSICDSSFKSQKVMNKHLKRHIGNKNFICEDCGKTFHEKTELKKHIWTHKDTKPYNCDVCNKGFIHEHSLSRHKPKCIDTSVQKVYSKQELRKLKKGQCPICLKLVAVSYLSEHKKTHVTLPRDFECPTCKMTFTKSKFLQKHQKTHLGVKSHKCSIPSCNKIFLENWELNRHLKTKHKIDAVDIPNKMLSRMTDKETPGIARKGLQPASNDDSQSGSNDDGKSGSDDDSQSDSNDDSQSGSNDHVGQPASDQSPHDDDDSGCDRGLNYDGHLVIVNEQSNSNGQTAQDGQLRTQIPDMEQIPDKEQLSDKSNSNGQTAQECQLRTQIPDKEQIPDMEQIPDKEQLSDKKQMSDNKTLLISLQSADNPNQLSDGAPYNSPQIYRYKCDVCNQRYPTSEHLQIHIIEHVPVSPRSSVLIESDAPVC